MVALSPETEALIHRGAANAGKSPDDFIRDVLSPIGETLPWRRATARPRGTTKEAFFAELDAIAARSSARPAVDPRAPDEIIGYDDFGLPR